MDSDRRNSARKLHLVKVILRVGDAPIRTTTVDISATGAFVATREPAVIGQDVTLLCKAPGETAFTVQLTATVARMVAPGAGPQAGLGLSFVTARCPQGRDRLALFLRRELGIRLLAHEGVEPYHFGRALLIGSRDLEAPTTLSGTRSGSGEHAMASPRLPGAKTLTMRDSRSASGTRSASRRVAGSVAPRTVNRPVEAGRSSVPAPARPTSRGTKPIPLGPAPSAPADNLPPPAQPPPAQPPPAQPPPAQPPSAQPPPAQSSAANPTTAFVPPTVPVEIARGVTPIAPILRVSQPAPAGQPAPTAPAAASAATSKARRSGVHTASPAPASTKPRPATPKRTSSARHSTAPPAETRRAASAPRPSSRTSGAQPHIAAKRVGAKTGPATRTRSRPTTGPTRASAARRTSRRRPSVRPHARDQRRTSQAPLASSSPAAAAPSPAAAAPSPADPARPLGSAPRPDAPHNESKPLLRRLLSSTSRFFGGGGDKLQRGADATSPTGRFFAPGTGHVPDFGDVDTIQRITGGDLHMVEPAVPPVPLSSVPFLHNGLREIQKPVTIDIEQRYCAAEARFVDQDTLIIVGQGRSPDVGEPTWVHLALRLDGAWRTMYLLGGLRTPVVNVPDGWCAEFKISSVRSPEQTEAFHTFALSAEG